MNDPRLDPPPWTPIDRPLAALCVALIRSGGLYRDDQPPFHFRNDTSHREIPIDSDRSRQPEPSTWSRSASGPW